MFNTHALKGMYVHTQKKVTVNYICTRNVC